MPDQGPWCKLAQYAEPTLIAIVGCHDACGTLVGYWDGFLQSVVDWWFTVGTNPSEMLLNRTEYLWSFFMMIIPALLNLTLLLSETATSTVIEYWL